MIALSSVTRKNPIKVWLLFPLLIGCSSKISGPSFSGTKITLDASSYGVSENIEIPSNDDFDQKRVAKESFILYFYNTLCPHCVQFSPIVEAFSRQEQIAIYKLSSSLVDYSDYIGKVSPAIPSIIIFSQGELLARLDPQVEENQVYYQNIMNLQVWIYTFITFKP